VRQRLADFTKRSGSRVRLLCWVASGQEEFFLESGFPASTGTEPEAPVRPAAQRPRYSQVPGPWPPQLPHRAPAAPGGPR